MRMVESRGDEAVMGSRRLRPAGAKAIALWRLVSGAASVAAAGIARRLGRVLMDGTSPRSMGCEFKSRRRSAEPDFTSAARRLGCTGTHVRHAFRSSRRQVSGLPSVGERLSGTHHYGNGCERRPAPTQSEFRCNAGKAVWVPLL